jgi:hypothetical protein
VLGLLVAVGPALVAREAVRRASVRTGSAIRVGWVAWNPLTGRWTLQRLRVAADRGPAAIHVARMAARVYLSDLIAGRYRIRALDVEGARVRVRSGPEGWVLPVRGATADPGPQLPPVSLDRGQVRRSTLRFEAGAAGTAKLRLRRLEVTGTASSPHRLRARGFAQGRVDRATLECRFRLRAGEGGHGVRLRLAATAVDVRKGIRLVGQAAERILDGLADVHARYVEAGHRTHRHRRLTGRLAGRRLAVGDVGDVGVRATRLMEGRFDIDLERRHAVLGRLDAEGVEVWVRRRADGLAIAGVLASAKASEVVEPSGGAPVPLRAWTIEGTGATAAGVVRYIDDRQRARPLELAINEAEIGAFGPGVVAIPFWLAGELRSGGSLMVRGQIVREPLAVEAHAQIATLALPPLVALAGSPLDLASGELSGVMDIGARGDTLEASGTLQVNEVKTVSPDPARPEDVLAWKAARATVRQARTRPPAATLERLEIDWPYVLVDRTPESIFPLSIVGRPTAPSALAPAPTAPFVLRIGGLRVHGGRIDFRDTTIEPAYWRALAALEVTAEGIEVPPARAAFLRGHALIDELSPLRFEGQIDAPTRIRAAVERLALRPFNPYLEARSAFSVSSGLLTADSEVVLDRSQLEVTNRLVLSRLGLRSTGGQDVLQPQLGIPLTLAIALMKDYRGDIALALPFAGNLAEPSFSLRTVIGQALVRAIQGAVLSPLNALGRVVLSEDRIAAFDIGGVPFPPGAGELDPAGRERVTQISRVLQAHPDLALRVQGTVAPEDLERIEDTAALAALADVPDAEPLRAFLRARLGGTPLPELDADRHARLERLRGSLPWPVEELYRLAVDRGAAVAAALLIDFKVEPQRVRVDEPPRPLPGAVVGEPVAKIGLTER